MLTRNTARHDTASMSQPPRNGPAALATPASPDHAPMARPRSPTWNDAEMMARLPGTSNAAAAPCTARAAISRSADGAAPQSSDATPNPHRPTRNTRRRPNRSPSEPPSTSSDPSVSRYAVITHCNDANPTSKSAPIAGSAAFTTVPSRNATPDPRTDAAITHRPAGVPVRRSGAASDVMRSMVRRARGGVRGSRRRSRRRSTSTSPHPARTTG